MSLESKIEEKSKAGEKKGNSKPGVLMTLIKSVLPELSPSASERQLLLYAVTEDC